MSMIVSSIGQGLLWAVLGVALFLTFRILNFPDMTVEGTFPLGAATAVAAISHGVSPLLATALAFLTGALAGLVTGLLYTKGKIPILLAGILVMTACLSINLRIMGGANISLLGKQTVFSNHFLELLPKYFDSVTVGLIIIVVVTAALILFLQTELGQAFIATGDNPIMANSLGINTDNMTIMGLMVSNGLIGMGGAFIAQNNGYADVNMGIGIIVIALASIIIGEVVFGELTLNQRLVAVTLGSILYRFVLLIVLQLGFSTNDLNLLSAVILAICLMLPKLSALLGLDHIISKGGQQSMVQNKPLLSLKEVVAYVNPNTPAQTALLNQLNLEIFEGDFITVIGPNGGAGKSTLFNTIAGSIPVGSGQLLHHGRNIAKENVVKRSQFISRVFQDPKMGTAPRMTVAENLNLAAKRGDSRTLKLRGLKKKRQLFKKLTASMNNGLADKLDVATENLSGGQRQALSFLMAIIKRLSCSYLTNIPLHLILKPVHS